MVALRSRMEQRLFQSDPRLFSLAKPEERPAKTIEKTAVDRLDRDGSLDQPPCLIEADSTPVTRKQAKVVECLGVDRILGEDLAGASFQRRE
jgi:hypothetical protein